MKELNIKFRRQASCSLLFSSCFALFLGSLLGYGQSGGDESGVGPFRTQTIQMEAGWNAVYLEIEPLKGAPSELFAGTPIEIAASYFRPVTPMGFIDSPDEVCLIARGGEFGMHRPARMGS